MSKRSVFCLASARAPADLILHELKVAGYAPTAISVLFLNGRAGAAGNSGSNTPETVTAPAAPSSTEIRGVMAWIDGIRSVVIPDNLRLIVAGPLANVFNEATVGGIAGGLIDFGLPRPEADRYERRIDAGQIFISVHVENPEASARAQEFFTAGGGEEIFTIVQIISSRPPLFNARDRWAAGVA